MENERQILLRKARAKIELTRREAKADFWKYCLYYDFAFFSKRTFLKEVANAFMLVYYSYKNGESYSLAVSMPPRSGKSYITSLFISWMIGHFPEESVMRNCCSDTLYQKLSYDTRDVIKSSKFQHLFPDVRLKGDKQNVRGWSVEQARQVTYFGGGVGGTIIGFGASMLDVTDDLYKSIEDARSVTINEKTWSWKQGTHDSRREKNVCHVDIGTRWSRNDVLGKLEENNAYDKIIRIAALNENDETFCEDVHTTEYYLKLREESDPEIFSAEYMQEPIEIKGLLFPLSELNYYDPSRINLQDLSEYSIFQIDPADSGDDFGGGLGYVIDKNVYIDMLVCNNFGLDYNVPASSNIALEYKPSITRIEGNGGWIQTCKDIKNNILGNNDSLDVMIFKETSNKEQKISGQAYFIKKRFWFRKDWREIPEYRNAMNKLGAYMRNVVNQKDDIPDLLASMSRHLRAHILTE